MFPKKSADTPGLGYPRSFVLEESGENDIIAKAMCNQVQLFLFKIPPNSQRRSLAFFLTPCPYFSLLDQKY
jgi:hypothetical protein